MDRFRSAGLVAPFVCLAEEVELPMAWVVGLELTAWHDVVCGPAEWVRPVELHVDGVAAEVADVVADAFEFASGCVVAGVVEAGAVGPAGSAGAHM